ncbi:signal peptide protein [Cupriavidus sp. SK-3]|uniref:hypothetical protein n=1 Tax=Cupriavidus TaxID=106589 RepID=UPI000451EDB9|nr:MULTISPECIES: hypothetical protein [Cupriavidus]KDP83966.1 signal peptide protein [Cupriavidus sp. SK-3]MDF3886668.1 hypothetical protein [Cupriavidus basilensis]
MKQLVLAACIGAFTLTTAGVATAQDPATKAAPAKKAPAKKAPAKKAATTETAAVPKGEKWQCELGHVLYIGGNMQRDEVITVNWEGKEYRLPRLSTVTGADRYFDARSGLDLVVIPSKAMLFNKNAGQRLADECQTADMQAGGSAPTQAGALRAPVATPLLVAPPAPAADAAPKQ